MAGGSLTTGVVDQERAELYKGKVTWYVIIACIVAATGGSLFGYDVGISGSSLIQYLNHKFLFFCFQCFSGYFISLYIFLINLA